MKVLPFFLLILLYLFLPSSLFAQQNSEYVEATIIGISEESTIIESNGNTHPYQKLQMMGNSGSLKGDTFTIENGAINQANIQKYEVGDKLILENLGNSTNPRLLIQDYSRATPIYFLFALFVLLTVIVGGLRGATALIGMALTFFAIFAFILPQIASGQNPVLITSLAVVVIIPITFLLSHGVNIKTLCAILSTFIILLFTGIFSQLIIEATHLTGFASEESSFLSSIRQGGFDIKGLLFAGIIIALFGILEDIAIAQAALVTQLKKANEKLSSFELFKRAMDVGRDHIASMANTLILVYTGASLPLLLLFLDSPLSFNQLISFEIISEEIVRTLTASIGFILAVPVTTLITVFALRIKRLTKLSLN